MATDINSEYGEKQYNTIQGYIEELSLTCHAKPDSLAAEGVNLRDGPHCADGRLAPLFSFKSSMVMIFISGGYPLE